MEKHAIKASQLTFARLPKTYSGLVALHMPRPIHDKVVYDNAVDLGDIIGVNRSIAYRILKGGRNLTANHVRKLAARFAVSADLFLA